MTRTQEKVVRRFVSAKLGAIFHDSYDKERVVDTLIEDVVSDIDETADWSSLEYDEVYIGDIKISLARILIKRIGL